MRKTVICILLAALTVLSLASCGKNADEPTAPGVPDSSETASSGEVGSKGDETTTIPANAPEQSVSGIKETFNQLEYAAYINIFYEKKGSDYVNKVYNKEGTFAVLHDEYNKTDRYYVWGYADKTRCCDWQWEFVPADVNALPTPGSLVKLKGKLVQDEKSLDGYRFSDVTLETVEKFTPAQGLDLTVLSPTLVRVQVANMQGNAEVFKGEKVRIFGRALNGSCLQHPYYDGSWNMDMILPENEKAPATGQYLTVDGVFTAENGGCYIKVTDCTKY